MNFVREFNELILLSNSLATENNTLVSTNEFISRLKKLNEYNNYWEDDLIDLKIKLLYSLSLVVRNLQKKDEKCSIINCMSDIIPTLVVDDTDFFVHLYNSLFYQIYDEQNSDLSEELRIAVLECCSGLIKRCTNRLIEVLYNEDYGSKFSMGVLIAIQTAREEKSFKLRMAALDFLLCAMQYHRKNDKVIQDKVGDLFMLYLPGVIGRLQEIILRNETQQHMITFKAVTCWGQLLCTVMKDLDEERDLTDEEQIKMWIALNEGLKSGSDTKSALKEKSRSKKWLEAASETIRPLIQKIPEARKHSHPKVRLELTMQISRLLENCLNTLKTSINPMIEILVGSCEDEDEEVREEAKFAIARFENRCRGTRGQTYLDFVQEHLHSVINKLPNVIHLNDDKSILIAMDSLCGDLRILSNSFKLGCLISFSCNLNRLINVLLTSLKLGVYPEISAQDYSVLDSDMDSNIPTKDWKRFEHFSDPKIYAKLSEICSLLVLADELETILDHLFERFDQNPTNKNEILVLINLLISSSLYIEDNVIEQVVNLYLNPDNLYLPIQTDQCVNLQQSRFNIITVALIMEGVGKLSKTLGIKFQSYLLRSLYFVVEKMGNSHTVIRTSAMGAAIQIAAAVGSVGNVSTLIQKNIDFLTYHVTVKLRRDNAGVFDVITVLMKNSPLDAISNLEEIINNVLRSSVEKFDSPYTIHYLRLFQTFVRCVNTWMREQYIVTNIPEPDKTAVDMLVEYIQDKNETKHEYVGKRTEGCKNLPKHIQLTVSITENALNYLPSRNQDTKLIVLEILNESVLILSKWENELLPIVHKIWSPLVSRFEQFQDPILINRSFTLLYNICRTSKDFVRRRTLKNVLPSLREFLLKSAQNSKLKDSGTGYQFTQRFKLQRELLNKLATLSMDLGISGKELDLILDSCLPYLSSFQPPPLQENCRKLFADLKNYDPYLVWYKLNPLTKDSEYSKNVGIVLEYIMSNE